MRNPFRRNVAQEFAQKTIEKMKLDPTADPIVIHDRLAKKGYIDRMQFKMNLLKGVRQQAKKQLKENGGDKIKAVETIVSECKTDPRFLQILQNNDMSIELVEATAKDELGIK